MRVQNEHSRMTLSLTSRPARKRQLESRLKPGSISKRVSSAAASGETVCGSRMRCSKRHRQQVPDADRAVVLFARGYRSALESGHARVVSSGGGASAPRITVDVSPDMTEVVSIDRETHKPRTFAVPTAAGKETWQVLSVASRARQRTDFLPEARRPAFVRGSVRSQKEIAGAQVRSSGLAWPGPRFDGYALVRAFADRLVAEGGAAGRRAGRGLRLAYRSPRHSQPLTIQVSRRAEPAYGFAEGRLTVSFNPLPRLGKIAIVRVGAPPGERWVGQLEHAGSFVTIRSHSKASVIGAARAISGNA